MGVELGCLAVESLQLMGSASSRGTSPGSVGIGVWSVRLSS